MPTLPTVVKLAKTPAEIINAVRATASNAYQDAVPEVEIGNTLSLNAVGNAVMGVPSLMNEFLTNLINKVGMTLITSKMYENPWAQLKRGTLEVGETVEEIFADLARPFTYNPEDAESTVFRREKPDVQVAFHTLNYKTFYQATIQEPTIRGAFTSFSGVTALISSIVETLSKSANFDEFLVMKYLLCEMLLSETVKKVAIPTPNAMNSNTIVSSIKNISNQMEFLKPDFNRRQVFNNSIKADQMLIQSSEFNSIYNVESLAPAFNMGNREFAGNSILADNFTFSDAEDKRLVQLFADDANFKVFTPVQKAALDKVQCIMVDRNYLMIFDYYTRMANLENPKGIYYNQFFHVWKIFSVSPFANACYFATA